MSDSDLTPAEFAEALGSLEGKLCHLVAELRVNAGTSRRRASEARAAGRTDSATFWDSDANANTNAASRLSSILDGAA